MNLLLLGGNSPHNKEWIEEVEKALQPMFDKTKIQYYDHWMDKVKQTDFELEYKKMLNNVQNFGEYVVFAKSMGTGLALKGIKGKKLQPQKCVFVGLALGSSKWTKLLLGGYDTPTLFIQQTNDPYNSFENIKKMIKENRVENYKLEEVEGGDHKYKDVKKIKDLIEAFLKE